MKLLALPLPRLPRLPRPARARSVAPALGNGWLLALGVLGALVTGAVAGSGSLVLAAALLAAAVLLLALTAPRLLFWVALCGCTGVAGLIELYLPSLTAARWLFAVTSPLFLLSVLLRRFGQQATLAEAEPAQPALTWLMLGMLLVGAASVAINWHGAATAVVGFKNYFATWSLYFGIALMPAWPALLRTVPRALLALGLLQLPFVAHQLLVLVPLRQSFKGLTPVDVVAGTFGATLEGGGNNATMSMFLIMLCCGIVALWRTGTLRARALLLLAPLLFPVFSNQSKVSFVYITLGFVIIFRREILERPARFIGASLAMLVLGMGLVWTYYLTNEIGATSGPVEYIEKAIRMNSEAGEKYGGYALNRVTVLGFWAKETGRYPMARVLLGHGPSESKDSSGQLLASSNLAEKRYPGMGIGLTSASALLWDFGVLGVAVVLACCVAAFRLAGRLARLHAHSPYRRGLFEACQACTGLLPVSLVHHNLWSYHPGTQLLTMTIFALLVAGVRCAPAADAALGQG